LGTLPVVALALMTESLFENIHHRLMRRLGGAHD